MSILIIIKSTNIKNKAGTFLVSRDWEPTCQCKGHGFDPWSGLGAAFIWGLPEALVEFQRPARTAASGLLGKLAERTGVAADTPLKTIPHKH